MALENWVDKQNGIDDILAEDINSIANAVIETQREINQIVIDQTYSPISENAQSGKAVAEAVAKSGGGTTDYEQLENLPEINGVELLGNKSLTDLGIDIPAKTSELENDSGFIDDTAFENYYTKTEVDEKMVVDQTYDKNSQNAQSGTAVAEAINSKQDTLISGTNIKTINGNSILGNGNISIEGGSSSSITVDQTFNPESENAQSGKAVAEAVASKSDKTEVDKLKDDIAYINKSLYSKGTQIEAETIRTGKGIQANGSMKNNTLNKVLFYNVTDIDSLFVSLSLDDEAVCDFCSDTWCSNATDVITTAYNGIIKVPSGAVYFAVSQKLDNTTNCVNLVSASLDGKVDKEEGKGLSTNDYSNYDKQTVSTIPSILNSVYKAAEKIEFSDTRYGYLDSNGNLVRNGTDKIVNEYPVTEGDKLYLSISKDSDYTFVFNTRDWPENSNKIGEVHSEAFEGIVEVPVGAKYLSVCMYVSNEKNIIALAGNKIDLNETEYKENPSYLRIGSYNIGHFRADGSDYTPGGTEENKQSYRNVIAELNCDILCVEEDGETFDGTNPASNVLYQNYKYKYMNGNDWGYTGNSILSDYQLTNTKKTQYTIQYHTKRTYNEADILIGGKSVHLVCTHFEARDKSITNSQIDELISHLASYDSVIVCGDFNPWNRVDGSAPEGEAENAEYVWKAEFKKWTDAGYKLANTEYFGNFHTLVGFDESSSGVWPWDNIAVSSNIEIKQVGTVVKDWMQDHCPIWAELVIY